MLIGPGRDSKLEACFHGPDPQVLRTLSEQAKALMRADPGSKEVRDDWREPVKVLRPLFNEETGRQSFRRLWRQKKHEWQRSIVNC